MAEGDLERFTRFWMSGDPTEKAVASKLEKYRWLLARHQQVAPEMPFGWIAQDDGKLIGGKFCFAMEVTRGSARQILAMSSSFRVAEGYGGAAVLLFKEYMRLGTKYPLIATSTNAASAKLWKAFRAKPVAGSDRDWLWLGSSPRATEERWFRKTGKARFAIVVSPFTRRAPGAGLPTCTLSEFRLETSTVDGWNPTRSADFWEWRIGNAPTPKPEACKNDGAYWAVREDKAGHRNQLAALRLLAWSEPFDQLLFNATTFIGEHDALVISFAPPGFDPLLQQLDFLPVPLEAPLAWILDPSNLLKDEPVNLQGVDSDLFS